MTALVSIGEFSRLTHLSVKALRHYHDVGVLIPAEVDRQTGYRRYSIAQLTNAHLVRRLRELDVPLDAVREVIASGAARRDDVIITHLAKMEHELARTREVVESLRRLLDAPLRPFDVEICTFEAVPALAVPAEVALADIGNWCEATFGHIASTLAQAGITPTSAFGALYTKATFEDGVGQVTAFAPIGADADEWRRVEARGLEVLTEIAGGTYATAIHRGPYGDLDRTYGALGAYVADHLRSATAPIREHYLIGPDEVDNTDDLQTMVLWPIET